MRYLILGIIFLIGFGFTNAFGMETHIGDGLFIMVQTSLRSSDGHLVTYLESTKFSDLNKNELNSFLDFEVSRGNDPIITIDGTKYQIIRRSQEISISSETSIASTILSDNQNNHPTILARFSHDGYLAVPGDTIESIWTFVRPLS